MRTSWPWLTTRAWEEMRRVVGILDEGEWITGGLWGAYEEWALGAEAAGDKSETRWEPSRWVIDEITATIPVS
jgi:hypothetical protein